MNSFLAWPIVRLESLAAPEKGAIAGGPFGSDLVSTDYFSEGVPVIRGVNLPANTKLSLDNLVFVSESKADALYLNIARPGDLVFTQRGTLGQVGLIPKDSPYSRYVISQSQMKMTVDSSKADPLYLYYYFRLDSTVQYIENHALQSGVPHINLGILRKLEVVAPPPEVQRKIAAFLAAYDDLIANNQRRITLLEGMAEEIYREWFVRMRFPQYKSVKMHHGVPENWVLTKLGSILELRYGKALKEESRIPGKYLVYGSGGIVGTHNEAIVKTPGLIVGRKGNVGSIYYADRGFFPIDTVFFVNSNLPNSFLYFLLRSMNFINNDAAVPGLNREQAYANELYLPPVSLIDDFVKIVDPLFEQLRLLVRQNEKLADVRNTLLPRLISGKLKVAHLDIQFPPSMREDAAA